MKIWKKSENKIEKNCKHFRFNKASRSKYTLRWIIFEFSDWKKRYVKEIQWKLNRIVADKNFPYMYYVWLSYTNTLIDSGIFPMEFYHKVSFTLYTMELFHDSWYNILKYIFCVQFDFNICLWKILMVTGRIISMLINDETYNT